MSVGKKPRKPLPRYTPLRSSGRRITPKKRSAKESARIYGDDAHQAWLRSHHCLICTARDVELAHTANGGTGRKADASTIVPLCTAHHRELHRIGVKSFEAKYENLLCFASLARWAEIVARAWQYHYAQAEPIASVVARVLPTLTGEDA